MTRICAISLCLFSCAAVDVASAQTAAYKPLGAWVAPAIQATAQWYSQLAESVTPPVTGTPAETRPQLPGVRPKNVELLEDVVLRKHPKLLQGSPERAGQVYLRRYNKDSGPLRGYTAEALFIDRNPEWGYIEKPNATQYDVYRRIPGQARGQIYGQVKYHDSGDPATYSRDMLKDYRASRFFIPDDHVEPTKAYLERQAERLRASGDELGASRARRNYARLRSSGFTSADVRHVTREVGQYLDRENRRVDPASQAVRQRNARYTSLGAAIAVSLAPILIDLAQGNIAPDAAVYQTWRSTSLLGVGIGADQLLTRIPGGALHGTARGNAVVGTALFITDTLWLMSDHGWSQALEQPKFYEDATCSLGALAIGIPAGTKATVLSIETGALAPFIGLGTTIVAGTAGCLAGRETMYQLIEVFRPEMHRREEREDIANAKARLDSMIRASQTLAPDGDS